MDKRIITTALALLAITAIGCGDDDGTIPPVPTYDDTVAAGWTKYEAGDFDGALAAFAAAASVDAARPDAFVGQGWSDLRRDALAGGRDAFLAGEAVADTASAARSDLRAGLVFALNAMKDYDASNAWADSLLADAPAWAFAHESGLDAADVRVVQAENLFALGDFDASLAAVKALNPAFALDTVATAADEAALAAEIERLRAAS
ncbi:hypothetical protein KDM41_08970 [bacterium]|nr:hypothetical protein [bacterium]